jgi:short subunit dehydrogenase-like uncharacterized protein
MYDVIIIGGTGFVGSRFVHYYANFFKKENLRVLVTARNLDKLKPTLESYSYLESCQLDLLDSERVHEVVKKGKIVVNFAGPFDLYAESVVKACAENGVHYMDITGEVYFAKRMIESYHETAIKNKAIIMPFSGFDSVPSEACAYYARKLMSEHDQKLASLDLLFITKGGFNGGTITTGFDMASKVTTKDLQNQNYLQEKIEGQEIKVQPGCGKLRYLKELKTWCVPFLMETINSKVVLRSIFLSENKNTTDDFIYRESFCLGKNRLGNLFLLKTFKTIDWIFEHSWSEKLLSPFVPAAGEGPSEKSIETGFFKVKAVARGEKGEVLEFNLSSQGDPSNRSTIKLIGSVMKGILKGENLAHYGVVTPSHALEDQLISSLESEEISFKLSPI